MTKERAVELCHAIDQYLCAGNPVWDTGQIHGAMSMAIEALEKRKTGKWIEKKNIMLGDYLGDYIECSLCKNTESRIALGWWNTKGFCPNCGAKMEKSE